ncbi:hypothetical protein PVV74_18415 [Roseovarius sp. SK2]|uniref:hypothetical protein n=1 Tax=Roseovarius TaxID=74030 RepID=UPI00237AFAF7|nr:hypothetical protein [Roseovarius sp. SK2]MDD9727437.1 hypothetical protein [Roseovarius sp. SK2]
MTNFFIGGALALALSSTSLTAAPIHGAGTATGLGTAPDAQVWLAQGNSGKGNGKAKGGGNAQKKAKGNAGKGNAGNANAGNGNAGNGNAKAKPDKGNKQAGNGNPGKGNGNAKKAGNSQPKGNSNGNGAERAAKANGKPDKARKVFTTAERENVVERIFQAPAPDGRDMTRILTGAGLALLTPDMAVSNIPGNELVTYANCPPGLAKKNPPCVPPGLARDGIGYDEWVSYDRDRYDRIWIDRRDDWLGRGYDVEPDPGYLLLRSDEIARLYGLDPAPRGQRYALIDGMPVLLGDDDYRSFMLVNQLAQVTDVTGGVPVSPTAALTQRELIDLYRLPQLGNDRNYAVVNGQVVQMNNENYELLQLLRVARAVL